VIILKIFPPYSPSTILKSFEFFLWDFYNCQMLLFERSNRIYGLRTHALEICVSSFTIFSFYFWQTIIKPNFDKVL
jgi:hypothetical protein